MIVGSLEPVDIFPFSAFFSILLFVLISLADLRRNNDILPVVGIEVFMDLSLLKFWSDPVDVLEFEV